MSRRPPKDNKEENARSASSYGWTRAENDFCSWMLLNGDDLFPPFDAGISSGAVANENSIILPRPNELMSMDGDILGDSATLNDFDSLHGDLTNVREDNMKLEPKNSESVSSTESREDKTDGPPVKKREQRLMRNREIARNCRKRKREKIEAMEKELTKLKEEKKELEMKVTHLQKAHSTSSKPVQIDSTPSKADLVDMRMAEFREINRLIRVHDDLVEKIGRNSDDTSSKDEPVENFEDQSSTSSAMSLQHQLKQTIEELKMKLMTCKELHSDFGDARENEIKFHMKQLERLLLPNQLSKMTLWSLQQEDDFYDENTNFKKFGGGLWNTLCSEFKLTKDQKMGLMAMRQSIRTQRNNVDECIKILKELDSRVETNFQTLKSQMSDIIKLTTPVQQAKFLMWIEKNQACMFMLNNLWEQEKKEGHVKKENVAVKQEPVHIKEENVVIDEKTMNEMKVTKEAMEEALKSSRTLQAMQALIKKGSKK